MKKRIAALCAAAFLAAGCFRDTPPDGTHECRAETANDGAYSTRTAELIGSARSEVLVIMYAVKYDPAQPDDPANGLLEALSAARSRGVTIRVLADNLTAWEYPATTNYMAAAGLEYRIDPAGITTHAKLAVIDASVTVIGSHNWTESALSRNNETSVVLHSEGLAKAQRDYFYRLYDKY